MRSTQSGRTERLLISTVLSRFRTRYYAVITGAGTQSFTLECRLQSEELLGITLFCIA